MEQTKINRKKIIAYAGILLVVIAVIWGGAKIFKSAPKSLYQVAVFAHDQNGSVAESMKSGDVLVIKKEEEGKTINWSRTEKISYLILKMELTEEQAAKLTQADEKEIPFKEWSDEEKKRAEEEEARAKEEDREYMREPKRETLRPRLYRIDLGNKVFDGFERSQLLNGQPFDDRVFDWGIVEKKKGL